MSIMGVFSIVEYYSLQVFCQSKRLLIYIHFCSRFVSFLWGWESHPLAAFWVRARLHKGGDCPPTSDPIPRHGGYRRACKDYSKQ
jgi:hypothetical protein